MPLLNSSMSSGYNGVAAILLKDVIQPGYKHFKAAEMKESVSTLIVRIISMCFYFDSHIDYRVVKISFL